MMFSDRFLCKQRRRGTFVPIFSTLVFIHTIMSSRSKQRGGTATENGGGKGSLASKQMIDRIKEATGQSEEDITTMLMECNYDVNETIVALIESVWDNDSG